MLHLRVDWGTKVLPFSCNILFSENLKFDQQKKIAMKKKIFEIGVDYLPYCKALCKRKIISTKKWL